MRHPFKRTRRALLGASVLGLIGVARPARAGTQVARFEVLHASPDLPAIDLYAGSIRIQQGLNYTQFSKRFVIATGTHQIRVFLAGADPNSPPILNIPIGLEPEQRLLVGIVNRAATLEGVAYLEPALPPAGQAMIRFINLEPGVPALDVVDAGNGAVLIPDVGFKTVKTATVPQATLTLQLRQAGTSNVVVSVAPTNFPGGAVSTLIKFAPEANVSARSVGAPPASPLILKRRNR
jgi:hypothetical protein